MNGCGHKDTTFLQTDKEKVRKEANEKQKVVLQAVF